MTETVPSGPATNAWSTRARSFRLLRSDHCLHALLDERLRGRDLRADRHALGLGQVDPRAPVERRELEVALAPAQAPAVVLDHPARKLRDVGHRVVAEPPHLL